MPSYPCVCVYVVVDLHFPRVPEDAQLPSGVVKQYHRRVPWDCCRERTRRWLISREWERDFSLLERPGILINNTLRQSKRIVKLYEENAFGLVTLTKVWQPCLSRHWVLEGGQSRLLLMSFAIAVWVCAIIITTIIIIIIVPSPSWAMSISKRVRDC